MALATKLEVISRSDISRIHEASLKILKETGVVFESEEAVEILKGHGVKIDGKTAFFRRNQVEGALEQCPATFRWSARNDARSITVGEGYDVQPAVGPVYVQDLDRGRRVATLKDFENFQKLCHASDVVTIVGATPVDPSDVTPEHRSLYMLYESLRHSDKPVMGNCASGLRTRQMLDMVEIALGKGSLGDECAVTVSVNPRSPLSFGREVLETAIEYAKRRQGVQVLPCILAGVSGPMSLLGTAVLQNAEILAGIALVQAINPGTPVVYCPASTAADMRTAAYVTGPPEQFLINIVNLQLALDMYRLPTRVMCGMTDSKAVDCQAGLETMQNVLMGALGGAHILHECLGVMESIMTLSYEKFIIDEEILGRVMRIAQGVEFSEEALALDVIQDVAHSGQYLTHENTYEHFREQWLPTMSSWDAYDGWKSRGSESIVEKANKKWKAVLANAPDVLIDPAVDRDLKSYLDKAV